MTIIDINTIKNIQERITYYNVVLQPSYDKEALPYALLKDIEFFLWKNFPEKISWTNDTSIKTFKEVEDVTSATEEHCKALHALIKEADTNKDTLEKIQKAFLADV